MVWGLRIHRPAAAGAWRALVLSGGIFSIDLALRGLALDLSGLPAVVLSPDLWALAGYVAMGTFLARLLRGSGRRTDLTTWLDVAVVTTGASLITWALLVSPALRRGGGSTYSILTSAAYPVADVAVLTLAALVALRGGFANRSLWLVLGAAGGLLVGDLSYAVQYTRTGIADADVPVFDLAFVLAYVSLGAAVLHPSMRVLVVADADGERRLSPLHRTILPAAILAPAAMPLLHASDHPLDHAVRAALMALLLGLVFVRLLRTVNALTDAEGTSRHRALHDSLTGLPNRAACAEELERRLSDGRALGGLALLYLDWDRFKLVNDTWGHHVGDELLVAVTHRLGAVLAGDDLLARVGGDEFIVLSDDADGAPVLAARILAAFAVPLVLPAGYELVCTPSIGIACTDEDGTSTAETLTRDADIAMYQAKENGRAGWVLFDESLRECASDRLVLAQDLRTGLGRGEIVAHYQPITSADGSRLVGFEALARWRHPVRGPVPPDVFIPIAEDTGDIVRLGAQVLRDACACIAQWRCLTGQPLHVSVNVSPVQLLSDDVPALVAVVLAETGLDADGLWLEITESAMVERTDEVLETLTALRRLGVTLCVDDFGTGYSALGYLKAFPMQVVKVDRSFVSGLGDNPHDEAITRAVIAMAHALEMAVVAEGVETQVQATWLTDLGCDMAQGWLYGRPQTADDTVAWMSTAGFAPALVPSHAA
jgi:diguanylate cyclase (GGDEF)-like protein